MTDLKSVLTEVNLLCIKWTLFLKKSTFLYNIKGDVMNILLKLIQLSYNNIYLKNGATSKQIDSLKKSIGFKIPNELLDLLSISNGIEETIYISQINQVKSISHIIYPIDIILSETKFYFKEYALNNILIFTNDENGNPYLLKDDYKVYLFNSIDGELQLYANNILEFFS